MIGYHLRVFALGAVVLAFLAGVCYLGTLLPFWVVGVPLLLAMAYNLGRLIEIWAKHW